jgi:hypothetical protein
MKQIVIFSLLALCLFACKKECCCDPEPVAKTITMQPGPADGNDVTANFHDSHPESASSNGNSLPELSIYAWSNSGQYVEGKAYISFDLADIPAGATITSAKLSLYGVSSSGWCPQGNQGDNAFIVQRVLSSWSENTLTWNNAPAVTNAGQVTTTNSTSIWNYDMTISVTDLVQDMINENKRFGFCLTTAVKSPYRSIIFGTSEVADAAKRPKLIVTYEH